MKNARIRTPVPGMKADRLYYDDACPLCRREMDKLAACKDDRLTLVPVSSQPESERKRLLSELHLQTAEGGWVRGLEANVRAWQHTRFSGLVSLLLHPAIRWAAEWGYALWLFGYRLRARCARRHD